MAEKTNIYICKVIKVIDDNDGLRIRARIPYFDYNIPDDQLPYAFPLLPKFLHVHPKVGECVLVFTQVIDNPNTDRFFIGPIISQPYMMSYETYHSATKLLKGASTTQPYQKVNMNDANTGVLPKRDDIAIEGRSNTDIVLKDNEVRLRCGYKKQPQNGVVEDRLLRNDVNPAYIQMKYDMLPLKYSSETTNNSLINIVADRINLLSHDSPQNFNLHDKDKLINDEELRKIFAQAHPMVYGDILVEYLNELVELFRTHHHPFAYKEPEFKADQNMFFTRNLKNELLAKNILIN